MKGSVFQRMDVWVRHLLPFGLTLILVLLNAMPSRLPGYAAIAPMLPLIGIYYWSIHRPDLMSAILAFVVGVVTDILSGVPLGVTAFLFLLVHGLTSSQRKFFLGKPFMLAWWGFAFVAGVVAGLQWALVSLIFNRMLDPHAVVFEWLLTVFCYPLFSWFFSRMQISLLRSA